MKRSVVIVAATALLATSAVAADLPRKTPAYAPPPLPPPFSWTGFYGGIHAGWGFTSDSDATVTNNIAGVFDTIALSQNSNGVVGGIQIGYNWQFAPNWVFGIEGDFSGTGIQNTTVAPLAVAGVPQVGATHLVERDVKWLASIRSRLGYAADRWLLYITGGGAWAGVDFTVGPSFVGPASVWLQVATRSRDGLSAMALNMPLPITGRAGSNICSMISTTRTSSTWALHQT